MPSETGKDNRSLTDKTLSGFLWMLSGAGAQSILQILVLVVLARLLSPEEFGVLAAALVLANILQIFGQLGIAPAIVQRAEITESHIRVAFTLSVIFSGTIAVALYSSSTVLADFFRMPQLEPVIRVLTLLFPIMGFTLVCEALLQRALRFRALATTNLVAYLVGYAGVGLVLAYAGFGVWALVIAQLSQAAIRSIILLRISPHSMWPSLHWKSVRDILNFGFGMSLALAGNTVAREVDNLVIGRWMGADALGVYGRVYALISAPTNLIGTTIDKTLFPAMAIAQNDDAKLVKAYTRGVSAIVLLAVPLGTAIFVLAPEMVQILLGSQWAAAVVPLQIFAAILVFRIAYRMSDSLVRAKGAVYRRAWRQWLYAAFVFLGAYIGHSYGLAGAATGVAIAIILNFLMLYQLSTRLISLTWRDLVTVYWRQVVWSLVCSLPMIAVAVLMRSLTESALLVAAVSLAVNALVFAAVIYWRPALFGPDALWLYETVREKATPVVSRLLRRSKSRSR